MSDDERGDYPIPSGKLTVEDVEADALNVSDMSSSGTLWQEILFPDMVFEDYDFDFKTWVERDQVYEMVKRADELGVRPLLETVTHDWLDLDDNEALMEYYQLGVFDITLGRPHVGYRWRLFSECRYTSNEEEVNVRARLRS